ncbi:MAG: hypothetical protein ACODAD_15060 [Planctomycetota bacterium]
MNDLYPWYRDVEGDDIEQGDIFESCPVYLPTYGALNVTTAEFDWVERDLIVLSQTCDMVKGREKLSEVLLCSVWYRFELKRGHLSTPKGMEDARRGNLPAFHVLAACDLPHMRRDVRVVEFRRVYALPMVFLRKKARDDGRHLRLLPPYREHLSQAFARFFMRVGLPVDVPPFK